MIQTLDAVTGTSPLPVTASKDERAGLCGVTTSRIFTITMLSIVTAACGYEIPNSCEISSLKANLSADELENCDQCGWATCDASTDEGESGDSAPDWYIVSPLSQTDYQVALARNASPQEGLPWFTAWIFGLLEIDDWDDDLIGINADDCPSPSTGWATRDQLWLQTEPSAITTHYCQVRGLGDTVLPYAPSLSGVQMCIRDYPQTHYEMAKIWDGVTHGSEWPSSLSCSDGSAPAGPCAIGPMSLRISDSYRSQTCLCDSANDDDDCQDGAVCEGGFIIEDGFPKPTYCIWGDQGNAPQGNGILPDGPQVYGFDDWPFEVAEDSVVVESSFITHVATHPEDVFNDDQRFDIGPDGRGIEVTYCGDLAMCSALGLLSGDVIFPPEDALVLLARGESIEVVVDSETGQRLVDVTMRE
jgi:hypothetical protein